MTIDASEASKKKPPASVQRRDLLGLTLAAATTGWAHAGNAQNAHATPSPALKSGTDLPAWRMSAIELAQAIRQRRTTARNAVQSVLDRIAEVNPGLNAIVDVMAEQALAQAQAADRALARGERVGLLHGVPVTIKVNADVTGRATTHGVVALRNNIAKTDSPVVANLRREGAVIVGRTNAPAFSVRWFSDNDVHGRTLNPFDPRVTPGGSSGGAAVAVATGMGPIAHGNDIGGSLRQPALACGVVGLRPTVGRVPSYSDTSPTRTITGQQMSVQGVLSRTVADATLALRVMSQPSPRDPSWVPAASIGTDTGKPAGLKVALFKHHPAFPADPSVTKALDQAAHWLSASGYAVEEATPPGFEEAAMLWRNLLFNDMRRAGIPAVESMGDAAVKASMRFFMEGTPDWSRDEYLEALARRESLRRAWSVFFSQYPVLLMPTSWEKALPIDDDTRSRERMEQIFMAMSPLTTVAGLGLPGLSLPTGISDGLPTGVQLVTAAFHEDLALRAGGVIESASGFDALRHLLQRLQ